MGWPEHFPTGCPPTDAKPASGTVYRLVKTDPPTVLDFQPTKIEQPHRDYSGCECQSCGVSVQREVDDARKLGQRVPALRTRQVAEGALNPSVGVLKPTPSKGAAGPSHHTWWLPDGIDPSPLFVVPKGGVA